MDKAEALDIFEAYLKGHGVNECNLLNVENKMTYFEIQSLEPHGIFFIDKLDGEITDNYNVFSGGDK